MCLFQFPQAERWQVIILILFLCLSGYSTFAQEAAPTTPATSATSTTSTETATPEKSKAETLPGDILLDLDLMRLDKPMPFDVPFEVCGKIPQKIFQDNPVQELTFFLAVKEEEDTRTAEKVLIDERAFLRLKQLNSLSGHTLTPKENQRLRELKSKTLDWKEVGTWKNQGLYTKPDAEEHAFCLTFPPLPAHTNFVLKIETKMDLSGDQETEFEVAIEKMIDEELPSFLADASLSSNDYDSLSSLTQNIIDQCKKTYNLQTDQSPIGPDRADQDYALLLKTFHFDELWKEIRDSQKAVADLETEISSSFPNYIDRFPGVINLIQDAAQTQPRAKETLNKLVRLGRNQDELFFLLKGQTHFHLYPARAHQIRTEKTIQASSIDKVLVQLDSSLRQLGDLAAYIDREYVQNMSRRKTILYTPDKIGLVETAYFREKGCVLKPSKKKKVPYQTIDKQILPQFIALSASIKSLRLQLLTIREMIYPLSYQLTDYESVRKQYAEAIVSSVVLQTTIVPVAGTTGLDFITRGQYFITADAGFAFSWQLQTFMPYAGVNFNFRALNRDAYYSIFRRLQATTFYPTRKGHWRRNSSLVLGVVPYDITTNHPDFESMWGNSGNNLLTNLNLMTGYSLRITDGSRLSVGAIWLKQNDGNPLRSLKQVSPVLYTSLSLDLDLVQYGRNVFRYFGTIFNLPDP